MKLHLIATLTIAIFASFCGKSLLNAQTPTAQLLTPDQEMCETSESIPIIIKFTGEAPFDARIKIWNNETNFAITTIDQVENFTPVGDSNYIGSYTFPPSGSDPRINQIKIEIIEVRDKSVNWSTIVNESAIITSYQTPTPNLATDASNCGLSIPIAASPGPHGNLYEWTTLSGPSAGSFEPDTLASTIFSGAEAGEYVLNFKVINGPCIASDAINVTLKGSPTGEISTTSEICATGDAELKFALTGNGPWNLKYSNGATQFPITGINTAEITYTHQLVNGQTIYNLIELTDANGCTAESGSLTGEASVIDLKPAAFAGLDDEICGDSFTMAADESSYSGVWIGPEGTEYSSINSPTANVTVNNYGPQAFIWELNNDGCADQDTVNITFWEQPIANAGEDKTLYLKYQTNLNAALSPGFIGTWSLVSGNGTIENEASPATAIKDLKMGSATLEWTVTNGTCEPASDNVTIEVKGLNHYSGFSPDGNNINEKFEITGAPFIENNELIVFNQVGQVVYKKNGYENDWTGTDMAGQPLPNGYYYFIFSGPGIDPIKDFLVIKRLTN
jgi:gliding motility-associated-like protein